VLGKAIVVIAVASKPPEDPSEPGPTDALLTECRRVLPTYMVPLHVEWRANLPRNPNGKIDRPSLAAELRQLFAELEA
jgi:acyl-CoA synthetase (AMP-forming)/AMP-acid ligase II